MIPTPTWAFRGFHLLWPRPTSTTTIEQGWVCFTHAPPRYVLFESTIICSYLLLPTGALPPPPPSLKHPRKRAHIVRLQGWLPVAPLPAPAPDYQSPEQPAPLVFEGGCSLPPLPPLSSLKNECVACFRGRLLPATTLLSQK
jgi:hypothetical protein